MLGRIDDRRGCPPAANSQSGLRWPHGGTKTPEMAGEPAIAGVGFIQITGLEITPDVALPSNWIWWRIGTLGTGSSCRPIRSVVFVTGVSGNTPATVRVTQIINGQNGIGDRRSAEEANRCWYDSVTCSSEKILVAAGVVYLLMAGTFIAGNVWVTGAAAKNGQIATALDPLRA